jgi:hypothetical protein
MEKESIPRLMAQFMKEIGLMINQTEKELNVGQMGLSTSDNTKTAKNVARESLYGKMEAHMKAIS